MCGLAGIFDNRGGGEVDRALLAVPLSEIRAARDPYVATRSCWPKAEIDAVDYTVAKWQHAERTTRFPAISACRSTANSAAEDLGHETAFPSEATQKGAKGMENQFQEGRTSARRYAGIDPVKPCATYKPNESTGRGTLNPARQDKRQEGVPQWVA